MRVSAIAAAALLLSHGAADNRDLPPHDSQLPQQIDARGAARMMAGTCGHREHTFPRKRIFTTILKISRKLLLYNVKI
jgi:hypothetical protein